MLLPGALGIVIGVLLAVRIRRRVSHGPHSSAAISTTGFECPNCRAVLSGGAEMALTCPKCGLAQSIPSGEQGPAQAAGVSGRSLGPTEHLETPLSVPQAEPIESVWPPPPVNPSSFWPKSDAPALGAPPDMPSGHGSHDPRPPNLANLKTIRIWRSWRQEKSRLPHYLIRGRGKQLEAILSAFVVALERERLPGVEVAFAGELANVPGTTRPLRVLSHMGTGHFGATDVVFRAEGSDLYVKFQSISRTWITFLRIAMHSVAFVVLFGVVFGFYLYGGGGFNAWVIEYANKYAMQFHENDASATGFMTKKLQQGYIRYDGRRFTSATEEAGNQLFDQIVNAVPALAPLDKGGTVKTFMVSIASARLMASPMGLSERAEPAVVLRAVHDMAAGFTGNLIGKASGAILFIEFANSLGETDLTDDRWFFRDREVPLTDGLYGDRPFADIQLLPARSRLFEEGARAVAADLDAHLSRLVLSELEACKEYHPPANPSSLFLADPVVAVRSVGIPAGFIAFLVGAGIFFLPVSILRVPCRLLRWPTLDEFVGMVQARNAWVERVLSDTLLREFDVQEGDRFEIMSKGANV